MNVGEFAVVAGNDQPTYIAAATAGTGATTAITLNEANKYATAAGAALAVYKACIVSGSYAAGWVESVQVTGFVNCRRRSASWSPSARAAAGGPTP